MNKTNIRTLGLIQQICGGNLDQNLDSTIQSIKNSAEQGAQIICLQELFRSQYFCQTEDSSRFIMAESVPTCANEFYAFGLFGHWRMEALNTGSASLDLSKTARVAP